MKLNIKYLAIAASLGLAVACTDDFEKEVGPRPTGSFSLTEVSEEANTYTVTSEVEDAFRYQWNAGEGWVEGSQTETFYFARAGEYTIQMRAMAAGGHAVSSKTVNVEADDPNACFLQVFGCEGSKTWELAGEGSLWVGPVDGSATWWSVSADDAAARTCQMNDQWTFNADGTLQFNNQGDFWVEDEGGAPHPTDMGLEIGCAEEWPAQYAEWGSDDSYTYSFSEGGSKLTVSGTGAFLGMYKAGDTSGASPGPEESITYNVISVDEDLLVVEKAYDWGKWVFTLRPVAE